MPDAPYAESSRRAVFFDRDGVLNVDSGFVWRVADFVWRPTAVQCVKWLNAQGVFVFVVTNQSGVARGFYGEDDVRALHDHMQAELRAAGAHVDDFRFCPHHPEAQVVAYRSECACRKPRSGMIEDLLRGWRLQPQGCRLFGDRETDLEAARRAGVPSTLVTEEIALIDLMRAAFPV